MKKKINLYLVIVAMIAILATAISGSVVFYKVLEKEEVNNLRTYSNLILETDNWKNLMNAIGNNLSLKKDMFNSNETDNNELRITVVSPDGDVIYDSIDDAAGMGNHKDRPEIKDALDKGEGQNVRKSETIGKNSYYFARRLANGYVLRLSRDVSSMAIVFANVVPVICLICIILLIVCVILARFLTKSIVNPIEKLAKNIDSSDAGVVYKELTPFVETIKRQHNDIMKNAKMRQEFTANVSHELKTPLTSISGYSELIKNGMATGDDAVHFATEIHKNSKRLLTLINDIIRLSELDQVSYEEEREEVNIYEMAESCIDMLQLSAKRHDVTINLHGEKQIVYVDKKMFDELIFNLCDNAIRYNNPNGSVDVSVTGDDTQAVIEVKDTGIGISKKDQERIFERFYRVDKSRSKSTGGTGLGLAIVKHIVAHHDNVNLELESEEGKGTCIRVVIKKISQN